MSYNIIFVTYIAPCVHWYLYCKMRRERILSVSADSLSSSHYIASRSIIAVYIYNDNNIIINIVIKSDPDTWSISSFKPAAKQKKTKKIQQYIIYESACPLNPFE